MKTVLPTDADVITVARAAMGEGIDLAEPVLRRGREVPGGLSGDGLAVLEQTLAVGVVRELVRRGGWIPRTAGPGDAAGQRIPGRLWERHGPVALAFSPASLEVLLWLVEAPLASKHGRCASRGPETLGDHVLVYLLGDLLARTGLEDVLADPVFGRCGPCRLALGAKGAAEAGQGAASKFSGRSETGNEGGKPQTSRQGEEAGQGAASKFSGSERSFRRRPHSEDVRSETGNAGGKPQTSRQGEDVGWGAGDRAVVLEALQADLAAQLVSTERRRRAGTAPDAVIAWAGAHEAALDAFLDAADAANRRDLATFVVDAAIRARALAPPALLADATRSLRERGEVEEASRVLERVGARLARWDAEHRVTRFFDDGYELAQTLIRRWEGIGGAV